MNLLWKLWFALNWRYIWLVLHLMRIQKVWNDLQVRERYKTCLEIRSGLCNNYPCHPAPPVSMLEAFGLQSYFVQLIAYFLFILCINSNNATYEKYEFYQSTSHHSKYTIIAKPFLQIFIFWLDSRSTNYPFETHRYVDF